MKYTRSIEPKNNNPILFEGEEEKNLFSDHIQDFGFDKFQTVVATDYMSTCPQENRSVIHLQTRL